MELRDICRPGMSIGQLFPQARREKGVTLSAVEFAAASGFYGAVEFAEVLDTNERNEISRVVLENDLEATYWLSVIRYESGVSISAVDEEECREAVGMLLPQLAHAAECRATYVGFLSGPDVPISRRPHAKRQLHRSVCELAAEAAKHGPMQLLFESLDREAHKKYLIGPTEEAVEFVLETRREVPRFSLAFDAAHIKLLGEDPVESLDMAKGVTSHVHLANCVSDPTHPQFGDNHMPFGEPGFLTRRYVTAMLRKGRTIGLFGPSRPMLTLESTGEGRDPWEVERTTREETLNAWQEAS